MLHFDSDIRIDRMIRSARRTLAIEITREGRLVVRVPLKASQSSIERFLFQKKDWITSRQKRALEKNFAVSPKTFSQGEQFFYLGKSYELESTADPGVSSLTLTDRFYLPERHLKVAERAFLHWYREKAMEVISERVSIYAQTASLEYESLALSNARGQWGSCSARNKLRFNWRLVMAPLEVIDYVVAHELAHLRHKNHSRFFWQEVERLLPSYKIHQRWLGENQHRLIFP